MQIFWIKLVALIKGEWHHTYLRTDNRQNIARQREQRRGGDHLITKLIEVKARRNNACMPPTVGDHDIISMHFVRVGNRLAELVDARGVDGRFRGEFLRQLTHRVRRMHLLFRRGDHRRDLRRRRRSEYRSDAGIGR